MRIFLSWSGERSKLVAAALRKWLPDVLYFVEPWMSGYDIHAGQRWADAIATVLEETNFGIICVTGENRDKPWLFFEAGALSKAVSEAAVVPLLLDVTFSDIGSGPLGQFQAKRLDRQGCLDVVSSINALSDKQIDSARLERRFNQAWPDLAVALDQISRRPDEELDPQHLPIGDVLEEIALGIQRIEGRLGEVEMEPREAERRPLPHERAFRVEKTARAPQIPVSVLRRAVEQTVERSSLRQVARDVGMSPMGLKHLMAGANPYSPTLRRLKRWYLQFQDADRKFWEMQ
jgi:hypothetical protein